VATYPAILLQRQTKVFVTHVKFFIRGSPSYRE